MREVYSQARRPLSVKTVLTAQLGLRVRFGPSLQPPSPEHRQHCLPQNLLSGAVDNGQHEIQEPFVVNCVINN